MEVVKSPWLSLPSPTHITLASHFFQGQFLDRMVLYETHVLYSDEVVDGWKNTIRWLMGTARWTTQEKQDVIGAMEQLGEHWQRTLRLHKS